MAQREPLVREYMTTQNLVSIEMGMTVEEAVKRLLKTPHFGLPVTEGDIVHGYINARELLSSMGKKKALVRDIMRKETIVADEDMKLVELARVMFREGQKIVPVVDRHKRLVGIISTTDIVRSHIERSDPRKVDMVKKLIEEKHGVSVKLTMAQVEISLLRPTQKQIHKDELQGRKEELEKGLAEPLIVFKKPSGLVLVDGHHRVVAARELGMRTILAHVLETIADIRLGMETSAEEQGLRTLDDIKVLDAPQHPLVELTLLRSEDY